MKTTITLDNKSILITGSAGFIGGALVIRLLQNTQNTTIIGLDNENDYYDPSLKRYRLEQIAQSVKNSRSAWKYEKLDISDDKALQKLFEQYKPRIIHGLTADRFQSLAPAGF